MKTREKCTKTGENSKNSTSKRECMAKLSQKEQHVRMHPVECSIHSSVACRMHSSVLMYLYIWVQLLLPGNITHYLLEKIMCEPKWLPYFIDIIPLLTFTYELICVNRYVCVLETGDLTGQTEFDLLPASTLLPVVNSFPYPFPGLLYPRSTMLDTFQWSHLWNIFQIIFLYVLSILFWELGVWAWCLPGWLYITAKRLNIYPYFFILKLDEWIQ